MKKRVLITGARAPAAVEMARLFGRIGAEVHVADSTPLLLAGGLRCVAAGHRLPAARGNLGNYGRAVAGLVERLGLDLVVPTCEEVFFLAAARDAGYGIPLFAPPLATLRRMHDKHAFVEAMRAAGIDAPETRKLISAADVEALRGRSRDLVFKPCFSRFGIETRIAPDAPVLRRIRPTPATPWVAQERLRGEEICAYAVAVMGRLSAWCAYRPLYRMGRAASYYFEPVACPEGEAIAAALVEATGFHGQIALDMIETPDRGLVPIECNPRATSGIHLFSEVPGLAARILDAGDATGVLRPAPGGAPAMVGSAMWLFGGARSWRTGVSAWRRDRARARDVLAVPGERLNARAWLVFASYCFEALRRQRSLRSVATGDIEWNGGGFDAGA